MKAEDVGRQYCRQPLTDDIASRMVVCRYQAEGQAHAVLPLRMPCLEWCLVCMKEEAVGQVVQQASKSKTSGKVLYNAKR